MVTKQSIDEFFTTKRFAMAGVSSNPKKMSRGFYKDLLKKNYEILPINPKMDDIEGVKCYHTVSELPDDVKHLIIMTPRDQTEKVVASAIEKGIKHIWMQQKTDTPEAIELAEKNNINVIYKECIFMHADPVDSVHSIHRFINKIFCKLPK